MTLQSLLGQYPNAGVIISGDRNDLDINSLLLIDSTLKQVNNKPTRGLKILDVFVTNLACFYDEPDTIPAIIPDVANKGVPSDHLGVIMKSLSNNQPKQVKMPIYLPDRPVIFSG